MNPLKARVPQSPGLDYSAVVPRPKEGLPRKQSVAVWQAASRLERVRRLSVTLTRFYWRRIRRYPSELCQSCGRPYLSMLGTWWSADDELWEAVEGGPGGLRCPPCFTHDCHDAGLFVYWKPVVDGSAGS